jgi:hypothetical protein
MIKVRPGTKAFDAWFEYYRGTKTQDRMMSCRAMRHPFLVPSLRPPEKPKADPSRVTARPERSIAAALAKADKPPARIDDIAERLEKRSALEKEDRQAVKSRRKKVAAEASGIDKAAQRVREGNVPRVDDLSDVGTRTVIDPDEASEVRNGKRAPDKLRNRVKLTSLRDDPVGRMASRDQITDDQLEAARRYQTWLHQAEIGGAKGIDPSAHAGRWRWRRVRCQHGYAHARREAVGARRSAPWPYGRRSCAPRARRCDGNQKGCGDLWQRSHGRVRTARLVLSQVPRSDGECDGRCCAAPGARRSTALPSRLSRRTIMRRAPS